MLCIHPRAGTLGGIQVKMPRDGTFCGSFEVFLARIDGLCEELGLWESATCRDARWRFFHTRDGTLDEICTENKKSAARRDAQRRFTSAYFPLNGLLPIRKTITRRDAWWEQQEDATRLDSCWLLSELRIESKIVEWRSFTRMLS